MIYNGDIKFTVLTVDGLAVARARIDFSVEEAGEEHPLTA